MGWIGLNAPDVPSIKRGLKSRGSLRSRTYCLRGDERREAESLPVEANQLVDAIRQHATTKNPRQNRYRSPLLGETDNLFLRTDLAQRTNGLELKPGIKAAGMEIVAAGKDLYLDVRCPVA